MNICVVSIGVYNTYLDNAKSHLDFVVSSLAINRFSVDEQSGARHVAPLLSEVYKLDEGGWCCNLVLCVFIASVNEIDSCHLSVRTFYFRGRT